MFVFVYGTLRGGHPYLGDATYMSDGEVKDYTLTDLGAFPGMCPKKGARVVGEVWNIHPDQVALLDRYEGPYYDRKRITVDAGPRRIKCHAYVYRGGIRNRETFSDWYAR